MFIIEGGVGSAKLILEGTVTVAVKGKESSVLEKRTVMVVSISNTDTSGNACFM